MLEPMTATFESLKASWSRLVLFLPRFAAAALLLVLGWLLARIIRKAVVRGLKLMRVDIAAEKAGLEDLLLQGGIKHTVVTILANITYWIIMFLVTFAMLNLLGLRSADELFNKILQYIPNVVVGVLVLIFGTLFAKFVRGVTVTYLSSIGMEGAEFISRLAQWALLAFVISVTLEQLSIGGMVLVSAFQIAFGALCLALAIAFGLGGRDWAARILDKLWQK
jgi:hypothetical protein